MKDPDATVRDAAVMALGNFDVDKSTTLLDITLRPDTVALLTAHYASETDPRVRGNIVKGLALSKNDSEPLWKFLISAVDDSSAEVRQFAAKGIGKAPAALALPKLIKLLSDSDRAVRLTAAQTIGRFGAAALEYQQELATASSNEKDQLVKDEIERALTAITTPAKQ